MRKIIITDHALEEFRKDNKKLRWIWKEKTEKKIKIIFFILLSKLKNKEAKFWKDNNTWVCSITDGYIKLVYSYNQQQDAWIIITYWKLLIEPVQEVINSFKCDINVCLLKRTSERSSRIKKKGKYWLLIYK